MAEDKVWVAYRYDPSLAAAAIFTVLFFLLTFLHIYQLMATRTWVFIPFVIGGLLEAIGYVGVRLVLRIPTQTHRSFLQRIISSQESPDWSLPPYIIQTLLLLVAPALYAASIYMVLGRIIAVTDGSNHSIIRLAWLTKIFVVGDIVSFVTQGTGGGIMSGGSANSYDTGEMVVVVGLVIQIIVFSLFMVTAGLFHFRMRRVPTAKVLKNGIPWEKHLAMLYISSGLILVRSVFRLIEYVQGNDGYLLSHEWFLYVFDAVLMFVVMVVFAWVHPSEIYALLKGGGKRALKNGVQVYEMDRQLI
jgi:hypothetical protein